MSTQSSLVEQVIARCTERRFTGLLRVRALEGRGEVSFLSGIRDTIVFDASAGDEALERLMRATTQEFEAIPRLPPFNERSSQPLPQTGPLGPMLRPVNLMRYCEAQSLTCTLDLDVEGAAVRINYELGELLSVEPESADVSKLLESNVGTYRINLPAFELPEAAKPKPAAAPVPRKPVETLSASPRAAAARAAAQSASAAPPVPIHSGAPERPASVTIPASRRAKDDTATRAGSDRAAASKPRAPALSVEEPVTPRVAAQAAATTLSPAAPKARPQEPRVVAPAADARRPEHLTATQRSRRRAAEEAPAAAVAARAVTNGVSHPASSKGAARGAPASGPRGAERSSSLEPWSPPSGPFVHDPDSPRQSGANPVVTPSSQRFYLWVLLAIGLLVLVALVALALA